MLGTQFDKLWGIAIDVARESGDPLGELLAKAVTDSDRAAAKRAFEAMMQMNKIDIAAIEAARRG